jgi:hypothetical protein
MRDAHFGSGPLVIASETGGKTVNSDPGGSDAGLFFQVANVVSVFSTIHPNVRRRLTAAA